MQSLLPLPRRSNFLKSSGNKEGGSGFFEIGVYHCAGNGKFGFTFAEVLITLGIIGLVAAMTMPVLIQNYQEKYLKNKGKMINIFDGKTEVRPAF